MNKEIIEKINKAKTLLEECLAVMGADVTGLEKSKNRITSKNNKIPKSENYSGPKGGVLLFIERGFFNTKKTLEEVQHDLDKEGYIYKKDVIRVALFRLSRSSGPLIGIDEGGKRFYVKRK